MDSGHHEKILEQRSADYVRSCKKKQQVWAKVVLMTAGDEMQVDLEGHEALLTNVYCWKQEIRKHYCFEEACESILNGVVKEPYVGNCFCFVLTIALLQKEQRRELLEVLTERQRHKYCWKWIQVMQELFDLLIQVE